jgi:hypothetical protein
MRCFGEAFAIETTFCDDVTCIVLAFYSHRSRLHCQRSLIWKKHWLDGLGGKVPTTFTSSNDCFTRIAGNEGNAEFLQSAGGAAGMSKPHHVFYSSVWSRSPRGFVSVSSFPESVADLSASACQRLMYS